MNSPNFKENLEKTWPQKSRNSNHRMRIKSSKFQPLLEQCEQFNKTCSNTSSKTSLNLKSFEESGVTISSKKYKKNPRFPSLIDQIKLYKPALTNKENESPKKSKINASVSPNSMQLSIANHSKLFKDLREIHSVNLSKLIDSNFDEKDVSQCEPKSFMASPNRRLFTNSIGRKKGELVEELQNILQDSKASTMFRSLKKESTNDKVFKGEVVEIIEDYGTKMAKIKYSEGNVQLIPERCFGNIGLKSLTIGSTVEGVLEKDFQFSDILYEINKVFIT